MAELKDIATWLAGFLRDHVQLKDDTLRQDLVDAWRRLTGADEPSSPEPVPEPAPTATAEQAPAPAPEASDIPTQVSVSDPASPDQGSDSAPAT